ncbi:VOC family protein [Streptomyces sp. NPDC057740]|uniref:VOC family protein n=1 Tax=Streptomyces sp. NPDC057740 TaxID=3346234 RepID=UPI0036A1AECF
MGDLPATNATCARTSGAAAILVPWQATSARQGAASGASSRRAGRKPSYWMYSGFRPVRREGVPGVATGQTLPAAALGRVRRVPPDPRRLARSPSGPGLRRPEAELGRLTALGATVVVRFEDHWVLVDPEGNEFCLFPIAP